MKTAVYPGSFDPMTNGHVDLVRRGCRIFDRVLVAVLVNGDKVPLFSVDERIAMVRSVFRRQPQVRVKAFSGLLVDFLRAEGANVVVRGLRVMSDFEYEFQMALMNRKLAPELETVFLMPKEKYSAVSSKLVREIGHFGGDLSELVPEVIRPRVVGGLLKP